MHVHDCGSQPRLQNHCTIIRGNAQWCFFFWSHDLWGDRWLLEWHVIVQSLTRFASRKSKTLAHDSLIIIPYQIYQCRIQNLSTDDSDDSDDSDDPNRPLRQFMAGGLEGSEAQQKSLGQALSECSGELQRQMAAVMLTQAAAMAVVAVVVRGWSLIRSEVESVVLVQFAVLFIGCSRDVAGVHFGVPLVHSKPCAERRPSWSDADGCKTSAPICRNAWRWPVGRQQVRQPVSSPFCKGVW